MALVEALLITTKKSFFSAQNGVDFLLPLAQMSETCSCSLSCFAPCVCEQTASSMGTCHLVLILSVV